MTNKEENQPNLNIKFKIKLIKKEKLKPNPYPDFSYSDFEKIIGEYFSSKKPNQRQVKMITTKAGMDLFNEALQKWAGDKNIKNEHRKKFNFRSKVFKQTYKFR